MMPTSNSPAGTLCSPNIGARGQKRTLRKSMKVNFRVGEMAQGVVCLLGKHELRYPTLT